MAVAEDSVIEYAPLLPSEFRDSRLLPNLLALAAEDAEEQRMTAAKLLGKCSRWMFADTSVLHDSYSLKSRYSATVSWELPYVLIMFVLKKDRQHFLHLARGAAPRG